MRKNGLSGLSFSLGVICCSACFACIESFAQLILVGGILSTWTPLLIRSARVLPLGSRGVSESKLIRPIVT